MLRPVGAETEVNYSGVFTTHVFIIIDLGAETEVAVLRNTTGFSFHTHVVLYTAAERDGGGYKLLSLAAIYLQ